MSDIGYPDAKQMDTRSTVAEMRDLVRRMRKKINTLEATMSIRTNELKRTVEKLRKEIIQLEQEVALLCQRIQRQDSELKLLRGESNVD